MPLLGRVDVGVEGGYSVTGSMPWSTSPPWTLLALLSASQLPQIEQLWSTVSFCYDGLLPHRLQNDETIWRWAVTSEVIWDKWNISSLKLIFSDICHSKIALTWLLTWLLSQNKAITGGSNSRWHDIINRRDIWTKRHTGFAILEGRL